MSDADKGGQPEVGRVEAFSDGVIAIIITIMVLELHAPEQPGVGHLIRLWPVFLAYIISFPYVGVYWVNHHRLFSHAKIVTNALVWYNLGLLFGLSLIPFSTAYLGEQHFSRDATIVYLLSMIFPAMFYVPLQHIIRQTGVRGSAAATYHTQTTRKGVVAVAIYIIGLALTFVAPWCGIAAAAIVAILWFLPKSPFDALFGD
jgi:uncharacterized membrane protein